jgi:hypothetical protein
MLSAMTESPELETLTQEYWQLIRESRSHQAAIDQTNVKRVLKLLEETAAGLRRELETIPRGILGARTARRESASSHGEVPTSAPARTSRASAHIANCRDGRMGLSAHALMRLDG